MAYLGNNSDIYNYLKEDCKEFVNQPEKPDEAMYNSKRLKIISFYKKGKIMQNQYNVLMKILS